MRETQLVDAGEGVAANAISSGPGSSLPFGVGCGGSEELARMFFVDSLFILVMLLTRADRLLNRLIGAGNIYCCTQN